MKSYITVVESKCIMCGACIILDSATFSENDLGIAYNKIDNNLNDTLVAITSNTIEAINTCPAKAIIKTNI